MSMENIREDDEIDLAQLFNILWNGKLVVITWSLIAVLSMLCYALIRTPLYKVEAVISQPQASNLIPIQPSALNTTEVHSAPKLDKKVVYNSVLLQLNSVNILREFWSQRFQREDIKNDKKFRLFIESLSVESVNPKGEEPQSKKVASSFADPKEGMDILNSYLDFINERIQNQVIADMTRSFKASLITIDNSIFLLEANGQKTLSYDLIKLRENYEIAKSLKISATPYKDLENIGLTFLDERDYLLGTDALGLQIATLSAREGKSLRAYNTKINDLFLARNIVESDINRLSGFSDDLAMFKIEKRAESSIDPIGVGKIILMVIGLIVGLIIGCLHVLLRNLIKRNGNN